MSDTEKLEVLIKAVDQATATLAKIEGQVAGLGKTSQKASGVTGQVSKMMTGQFGDVAKAVFGVVAPIATVGAAVVTTAKFVAGSITDWVAYNEEMRKLGEATGVTTSDLSRLLQAADDVGVGMGSMQTAMKLAAQNGVLPTIANIADLSDKLLALESDEARVEQMQKIFGKQWQEVAGFVLQGGDAIREGTAAIEDSLVVTKESSIEARKYAASVDVLNDSWTGFKNELAKEVIPALTDAATGLADWMKATNEFTQANDLLWEAAQAGVITGGEYYELYGKLFFKTIDLADVEKLLTDRLGQNTVVMRALGLETAVYGTRTDAATKTTETFNYALEDTSATASETIQWYAGLAVGVAEYEGSVSKADYATKSLTGAIGAVPKKVNIGFDFDMPDVTSEVGNLVKGMKWEAAGGTAIEQFYAGIKSGLAGLSLPDAAAIGAQLGALELSAKVKIGDISKADATTQLMDAFGLSYGEAAVTLKAAIEADPTSAEGIQAFLTETLATPTKAKIEPEVDPAILATLFGTGDTGLAQTAKPSIDPVLNLPIYEAVYGTMSTAVNVPTFSVLNMPSYLSIKSQITTPLTIPVRIQITGTNIGALEKLAGEDLNGNGAIGRATGGPVSAGQPYWVGERGVPELFIPSQSGEIVPANKLAGGAGVNNYYSMTINTSAKTEPLVADFNMMKAWGG
jgi:hypothetical protein